MKSSQAVSFLLAIAIASGAVQVSAETWVAGAAVVPPSQGAALTMGHVSLMPCSVTWFSPGVFTYPNGDLAFLAQGRNLAPNIKDSIFGARRNSATGQWQTPASADAPALTGLYMTGGSPQNCGYSQTTPGPVASPKVVFLPEAISGTPGGRYYMAFVGGNGDFIRGQVYWGTSTDAVNWTIWKWSPLPAGFSWRPLVGPLYGPAGYSPDPTCYPYGITQLMLTYDSDTSLGAQGGFYLHLVYQHWVKKPDGTFAPNSFDMLSYRFSYTTSNAFGLGGNGQIYTCDPVTHACQWVAHSGQMVWDYDGQAPAPGDPILHAHQSTSMAQGPGDIVKIPSTGRWLHIGSFNQVFTQSASSLALQDWSVTTPINRAALDLSLNNPPSGPYPGYLNDAFDPGLWYGLLGTRTGIWGFFPVRYMGTTCSAFSYRGLAVVVAPLDSSP
jgi:hypothetical protein